jgi:hypothetical protein
MRGPSPCARLTIDVVEIALCTDRAIPIPTFVCLAPGCTLKAPQRAPGAVVRQQPSQLVLERVTNRKAFTRIEAIQHKFPDVKLNPLGCAGRLRRSSG